MIGLIIGYDRFIRAWNVGYAIYEYQLENARFRIFDVNSSELTYLHSAWAALAGFSARTVPSTMNDTNSIITMVVDWKIKLIIRPFLGLYTHVLLVALFPSYMQALYEVDRAYAPVRSPRWQRVKRERAYEVSARAARETRRYNCSMGFKIQPNLNCNVLLTKLGDKLSILNGSATKVTSHHEVGITEQSEKIQAKCNDIFLEWSDQLRNIVMNEIMYTKFRGDIRWTLDTAVYFIFCTVTYGEPNRTAYTQKWGWSHVQLCEQKTHCVDSVEQAIAWTLSFGEPKALFILSNRVPRFQTKLSRVQICELGNVAILATKKYFFAFKVMWEFFSHAKHSKSSYSISGVMFSSIDKQHSKLRVQMLTAAVNMTLVTPTKLSGKKRKQ